MTKDKGIKMVYLIVKGEVESRIILVKAQDKAEVERRIKLQEGESIVGCLTTSQIQVLYEPSFVVVTS